MASLTASEVSALIKEGAIYKTPLQKAEEVGMANIEKDFREKHAIILGSYRLSIEKEINKAVRMAQTKSILSNKVSIDYITHRSPNEWYNSTQFTMDSDMTFTYPVPDNQIHSITFNPFKKYNVQPVFEILTKEYTDRGFKVVQESKSVMHSTPKKECTCYYLTISWE
jgi:hypothetical protein